MSSPRKSEMRMSKNQKGSKDVPKLPTLKKDLPTPSSAESNEPSTEQATQLLNQEPSGTAILTAQFQPSGDFEDDFVKLCQFFDIYIAPRVVQRPRDISISPERDLAVPSVGSRQNSLTAGEQSFNLGKPTEIVRSRKNSRSRSGGSVDKQSLSTSRLKRLSQARVDQAEFQTFTLADRVTFFMPCVQIRYQQQRSNGAGRGVDEMYIRGWRVQGPMLQVMRKTWQLLTPQLTRLQLWNVGLTAESVRTLARVLPCLSQLSVLLLDANPMKEEDDLDLGLLIGSDSSLECLSLRFCQLTDLAARGLSFALGSTKGSNTKLLSLNLSHNLLSDEGARLLARSLMTNRTLIILNLASNHIGDPGANALSQALSCFPLSQEQLLQRRWVLSQKDSIPSPSANSFQDEYGNVVNSRDLASSDLSKIVNAKKDHTKKSSKKSVSKKDHQIKSRKDVAIAEKTSKQAGNESIKQLLSEPSRSTNSSDISVCCDNASRKPHTSNIRQLKKFQSGFMGPYKDKNSGSVNKSQDVSFADWHPLTQCASLDDKGKFWVVGNLTLLSLNLSSNFIKEGGLRCLLGMVQMQSCPQPCQFLPLPGPDRPQLAPLYPQHNHSGAPPGTSQTGLTRLILEKNVAGPDNPVLRQIQQLMLPKDPNPSKAGTTFDF